MILDKEIKLIKNKFLQKATYNCVKDKESILLEIPASITGLHHPIDERGKLGLVNHIKKMIWFCRGLQKEFQLPQIELDYLITASIFHDISNTETSWVEEKKWKRNNRLYRFHPLLSANIFIKYLVKELDPLLNPLHFRQIISLILSHMEHWNPEIPLIKTKLHVMFCMADYFTSRSSVQIDVEGDY